MSAKRRKSNRSSSGDEAPEIDDQWLRSADQYDGPKLVRRGRPKLERPRKLLSLRMQPDIIERWKATGPGWQTRMVKVLERAAPK